jgi:HSP20 family protein
MTSTTVPKWLPAALAPYELSALSWLSMLQSPLRVEEHVDSKTYTLRAEIPGVDPEKDVTVTYQDGALRLQIHRADVRKDKTHTEFNYGSYDRVVATRSAIDEDTIHASYQDGILEIKAKVSAPEAPGRTIPITVTSPKHAGNGAKH